MDEQRRVKMSEMKEGESGKVVLFQAEPSMRERFQALGMEEGVSIKCLFFSFAKDPIVFEICDCVIAIRKKDMEEIIIELEEEQKYSMTDQTYTILLAGNPNVGKSTLFNYLTGLHQHTGNWTGKTVESAKGFRKEGEILYQFYDLPGTYSLHSRSEEEKEAEKCLRNMQYDKVIVVCDASCLKRNLLLVLEIMELTKEVVLCVNLLDEAKKKGIEIDLEKLENLLQVPVVGCVARRGEGIEQLLKACRKSDKIGRETKGELEEKVEMYSSDLNKKDVFVSAMSQEKSSKLEQTTIQRAENIASQVIHQKQDTKWKKEETLDRLLTRKSTGIPIMLLLLFGVFWITMKGANTPSDLLARGFEHFGVFLNEWLLKIHMPEFFIGFLMKGIYQVTSFVISVMLPPMMIFFPLFTLLEDYGFLPRIALNLDHIFQKCHACGKQALTMCMGFGCSAVGVTGCRIIDSKRERLIAMLTNCLVPCNGKFPTLVAMIGVGMVMLGKENSFLGALILTGLILLGVAMTFFISYLLSITLLKGVPSAFTLELPPYRRPQFGKVLIRSFLDRTLFVLRRAVVVAMPAGILLFLAGQIQIQGIPLTMQIAHILDPIGRQLGLDGIILTAFLFGFPANEIIVPIMLMLYLSTGDLVGFAQVGELKIILQATGWTLETVICVCIFMLFHYPCSTTVLTMKKETNSWFWTFIGFLLPTLVGVILCMLIHFLW
ncbi:MAG: ferrous iron transport protein B [Clostridiales bacterium]|nr:ferrous iron transport protein B [Clostridiales bacterium]